MQVTETTRFNEVGFCIYCGASKDLTDEHVIPFALDGKLVLPKSSCIDCSAITSRFEHDVLRGFMLQARTVGRLPTRRPRQRPSEFGLQLDIAGKQETRLIESADFPALLQLPVFLPPGVLERRSPSGQFSVVGVHTIRFGKHPLMVLKQFMASRIHLTATIQIGAFTRFLAKIAYSYSVGVRGTVDISKASVLPYIRGEVDDGAPWIGSSSFTSNPNIQGALHTLAFVKHELNPEFQGLLDSVRIRLFASSGGPGYEVVVQMPEY